MDKNIKKISAMALCATIACSGLGNCGYAQWDEDDDFSISREGLDEMPENNDAGVSTPLRARVPGTPEANRYIDMELLTPMRHINFNDDCLVPPQIPEANRYITRGPLTPVHLPNPDELVVVPQTPVTNRLDPREILSPVPFPGFESAL